MKLTAGHNETPSQIHTVSQSAPHLHMHRSAEYWSHSHGLSTWIFSCWALPEGTLSNIKLCLEWRLVQNKMEHAPNPMSTVSKSVFPMFRFQVAPNICRSCVVMAWSGHKIPIVVIPKYIHHLVKNNNGTIRCILEKCKNSACELFKYLCSQWI